VIATTETWEQPCFFWILSESHTISKSFLTGAAQCCALAEGKIKVSERSSAINMPSIPKFKEKGIHAPY
jgi:hypothetical protein